MSETKIAKIRRLKKGLLNVIAKLEASKARELEVVEALSICRGQWMHSVNTERNFAILNRYGKL